MKKAVLFILFVLAFIILPCSINADTQLAENIVSDCSVSGNSEHIEYLYDSKLDAMCQIDTGYINIDFNLSDVQGIYIKWDTAPSKWLLECKFEDGSSELLNCGGKGFLQEYCNIPQNTRSVSISSAGQMKMLEIEIYSRGELPEAVHIWEETPTNAELMIISTHQDDELLFFGGTIPYYSGELKLDTVVLYATYDNGLRLHEALEGLWQCGHYQHPVFLRYEDRLTYYLQTALDRFGEKRMTDDFAEYIVRFKPQVVVTHDFNGEYGHGQHKAVAYCLSNALEIAAQGTTSGKWDTPKCYIHLYEKNSITIEWKDMKLDRLGGLSALECASQGYEKHVSQHIFNYAVLEYGYGDCRRFGLYRTNVGKDTAADFFENITPRIKFAEIPDNYISSDMKKISTHNVYERIIGQETQYLRYGKVGEREGWFLCDSSGSLPDTIMEVVPMEDLKVPDGYAITDTFYPAGSTRPVYTYVTKDGTEIYVRYGTIRGITGWYSTDESGEPMIPLEKIEVPKQSGILNIFGGFSEDSGQWLAILFPISILVIAGLIFAKKSGKI